MDRIWQWVWDRYPARYSWAMFAIGFPLVLQVYLLFSIVVLAIEKSDHYIEAAAVTVVAVLVEQYVIVRPGLGRIRVVERWQPIRRTSPLVRLCRMSTAKTGAMSLGCLVFAFHRPQRLRNRHRHAGLNTTMRAEAPATVALLIRPPRGVWPVCGP
jgi:hypothetical protein